MEKVTIHINKAEFKSALSKKVEVTSFTVNSNPNTVQNLKNLENYLRNVVFYVEPVEEGTKTKLNFDCYSDTSVKLLCSLFKDSYFDAQLNVV